MNIKKILMFKKFILLLSKNNISPFKIYSKNKEILKHYVTPFLQYLKLYKKIESELIKNIN